MDERITKITMMNDSLKKLLVEFKDNIKFDYDLKKKIGLILVVKLKYILKLTI